MFNSFRALSLLRFGSAYWISAGWFHLVFRSEIRSPPNSSYFSFLFVCTDQFSGPGKNNFMVIGPTFTSVCNIQELPHTSAVVMFQAVNHSLELASHKCSCSANHPHPAKTFHPDSYCRWGFFNLRVNIKPYCICFINIHAWHTFYWLDKQLSEIGNFSFEIPFAAVIVQPSKTKRETSWKDLTWWVVYDGSLRTLTMSPFRDCWLSLRSILGKRWSA